MGERTSGNILGFEMTGFKARIEQTATIIMHQCRIRAGSFRNRSSARPWLWYAAEGSVSRVTWGEVNRDRILETKGGSLAIYMTSIIGSTSNELTWLTG